MLIAQITDLHAGVRLDVAGRQIDTLDCVREAVAHLNGLSPSPDAVIVTGDLVAEETLDRYEAVARALGELSAPFFVIPGNHDDRDLIRQVFGAASYLPRDGDFIHYVVDHMELRLVALDTHDPGVASGLLCRDRLAWLEQRLGDAPDRPTLIALHHPPFLTGIAEFDGIGLEGRDAFGRIVKCHAQIQAIACGHVHRSIAISWNGTLVTVTPSTGYQYALHLSGDSDFEKVADPRACRLFHWNPDVGLASHVSYF